MQQTKVPKRERRALLNAFIRKGTLETPNPGGPETRDLTEGSPQATQTVSKIVQGEFFKQLVLALKQYDRLFDAASVVQTTNGSQMLVPVVDDTGNPATVVSEGGQDAETDPTTAGVLVPTASNYRTNLVKMSLELLEDEAFDAADYLARSFAVRLARGIGAGIITTALAGATSGATGSSNSTVSPDDVLALIKSVDPAYLQSPRAGLAMNWNTLIAILGTKGTSGNYLIPPPFSVGQHTVAEQGFNLFGLPVYVCPSMPAIGSQAKPVLCGDLAYIVVRTVAGDRTLQRLDERFADYGQVAFRGWMRASAAVAVSGALKYLTCAT
jgi:HK97 family phage major capsid protein